MIGGAENLWRGLQDHINEHTPHQAEIIKLPSRELSFWELVDSLPAVRGARPDGLRRRRLARSTRRGWSPTRATSSTCCTSCAGSTTPTTSCSCPDRASDDAAPVRELRAFMARARRASARRCREFFARLAELRGAPGCRDDLFAFPGPFIRELVHCLDGIGLAPSAIRRYGAISATVRERPDYFPPGAEVFVAHPPTALAGLHAGPRALPVHRQPARQRQARRPAGRRRWRTSSATSSCGSPAPGPEEARLRELAAGDPRISFCGRVARRASSPSSTRARARSRSSRTSRTTGYVTLEAMLAGKPVITCTDSGGTTELVARRRHRARRRAAGPEALGGGDRRACGATGARPADGRGRARAGRRGDVGRASSSELGGGVTRPRLARRHELRRSTRRAAAARRASPGSTARWRGSASTSRSSRSSAVRRARRRADDRARACASCGCR